MTNDQIEQTIVDKGLTAPRITPAMIEAAISSEHYFTAYQGASHLSAASNVQTPKPPESLKLLTICVLVLTNGFTVTGESACASPANFDAELGRTIARLKATEKIWPLEGYRLKQWLSVGASVFTAAP